jgi:hypothetical protein
MRKAEKVIAVIGRDDFFWWGVYPLVEPDGRVFLWKEDDIENTSPFVTMQNCSVLVDWGDVDENYRS